MYEYRYENVKYKQDILKNILLSHREIIDNLARDGWRFVSAIPTLIRGYGMISELDLVFEREVHYYNENEREIYYITEK